MSDREKVANGQSAHDCAACQRANLFHGLDLLMWRAELGWPTLHAELASR